ncbi:MAG TPA: helix-turn-helix domain-containing protein [Sphingomonas sp.]|nr:helix-turn-helix domain-containing protein [Sphingomonas sp.]
MQGGTNEIAVPHSVLDATGMPPERALAFWRESMAAFYDVRARTDAGFRFRAEAFHLGEIVVTAYACSAQTYDRSRLRIGRDGLDHVTLQLVRSGTHGPRDGSSEDHAGPGDILIADLAQPQATIAGDSSTLNLTVPRRLLGPLLDSPDVHNLRRIRAGTPLVALFGSHLETLFRTAPSMRGKEAEAVVRPTLELAAALLNAQIPEGSRPGIESILGGQIGRFLADHATDRTLSPEGVAARFGISRRKLYYLLEPYGGFTACLREHRLSRARALLGDPAQRDRPVAEIAESCGFAWRTNFARSYRHRFGLTPRETRELAAQGPRDRAAETEDRHMWDWIRALR